MRRSGAASSALRARAGLLRDVLLGAVFLGAAVLAGGLLGPAGAAAQRREAWAGLGEAGTVKETLAWKALKGGPRKETVERRVLKVPRSYGQLVSAEGADEGIQSLWFVDREGRLRNVLIPLGLVLIRMED